MVRAIVLEPSSSRKYMRTVLVDIGPMAHMSGRGPLTATDILGEQLIEQPGSGMVIVDGVIERISTTEELISEYGAPMALNKPSAEFSVVSAEGCAIIPGFVDAHTHLLWAGDRSREVLWKHQGKSYQNIASMGGGIQHTVESTRQASTDELFQLGYQRLRESLRTGTTHLEAKSGYGLSTTDELRLLEIASKLDNLGHLPTMDLTWLGAHDTPKGHTTDSYVEEILSQQLPSVLDQGIARSADVFCEPGWFTVEQSEDILKASRNGGLDLRMHIDEFEDGKGGELAAELKVTTGDHAHHTSMEARMAMNDNGVNTGFLPGTPYSMGSEWPDFNQLSDSDIVWSVASDFNPNCKTLSLPFLGSLLVQRCKVHPLIALAAVTRNPAQTTPHPRGLRHGQIVEGGVANFNIMDSPHWESWCIQPSHSPIRSTCLNGELIHH